MRKSFLRISILILLVITWLAVICGCATIATSSDNSYTVNFEFEKIDGKEEYRVKGLKAETTETDIVIPSNYEGLPVTEIKDDAFSFGALTSVVIPDSVISIGM